MVNNILISTTFKNSTVLLKPFYSFYKDIWNPRQFVFFIGVSESYRINEFYKNICNCLNITLTESSYKLNNIPNAYNIKLYKGNENINVIFYNTELQYNRNVWATLRENLFKLIHTCAEFNTFDYYLNTDNDDFFYIKDVSKYLTNYNINKQCNTFHGVEFVSHDNFNVEHDLNFISHSYYFRVKSSKKLDGMSSHGYCRQIYLNDKIKNEGHVGKDIHICNNFDIKLNNNQLNDITDFDRVCFSFGCLDLKFLMDDKHFLQSSNITERYSHTRIKIEEDFRNYYKLTTEEESKNIIINCNFLQKYFTI
jgi:hypothetical protein